MLEYAMFFVYSFFVGTVLLFIGTILKPLFERKDDSNR